DIGVFDIMMPAKDGYSLAEEIRATNLHMPIIFLSAKSLPEDVIKGFKIGANDYLKKPFNIAELLVRIEAILRRFGQNTLSKDSSDSVMYFGKCVLDPTRQELKTSQGIFKLSYKESVLLELLIKNRNQLLSREEALLQIWGNSSYYNSRSMDVFM